MELALPPLPARPGKTVVLRLRLVSYAGTQAGCNSYARVAINGTALGRYMAGGDERLFGRAPSFEFTEGHPGSSYPVFNGTALTTMFAPDVDRGDRMSTDGAGGYLPVRSSPTLPGAWTAITFPSAISARSESQE